MQELPQWQEKVDKVAAALMKMDSSSDEVRDLVYQHEDDRYRLHAIISLCDTLDDVW